MLEFRKSDGVWSAATPPSHPSVTVFSHRSHRENRAAHLSCRLNFAALRLGGFALSPAREGSKENAAAFHFGLTPERTAKIKLRYEHATSKKPVSRSQKSC
jgi:hypothetical protein